MAPRPHSGEISKESTLLVSFDVRTGAFTSLIHLPGLLDPHPESTKRFAAFARLPWIQHLSLMGLEAPETNPAVCDEGGGFDLLETSASDLESIVIQAGSTLKRNTYGPFTLYTKSTKDVQV